MRPTVTFETQCYENDYEYLLVGDRLEQMIANCNYNFTKRTLIINKVNNRQKVAGLAEAVKQRGIIDEYYFAEDHVDEALAHFQIDPKTFEGGYYVSRCKLVGLYRSETDYQLHFTTDSHIPKKNNSQWIAQGIELMEKDARYVCATPLWDNSLEGAKAEAVESFGDWFAGYGFSDNCYLVPTKLFKTAVYHEYNPAAERYPAYAGNCFERRVDSYMRNHGYLRLINKKISYVNTFFPKKWHISMISSINGWVKRLQNILKIVVNLPQRQLIDNRAYEKPAIIGDAPGMKEYRKKVKIYDTFIFFNELEMLEIRLNVLYDHVDHFVIVESTKTFSGLSKKLFYQENKDRFKQFQDKIIHYVIDDLPENEAELRGRLKNPGLNGLDEEIINTTLTTDNIPQSESHWLREFYQKEAVKRALVGLRDNDICFISDADEIWDPTITIDYRSDDIFKLKQLVYTYYLNNRSSEPWAGTYATKYLRIKNSSLNHLDTPHKTRYTYIQNGGWHFTNQGGADRIRKKLESYGHQEFNNDVIKSSLEEKMQKNTDFVGRKFRFWVDERDLPAYLKNNREKYKDFFR